MMTLYLECGKETTSTKTEMAYQLDSCFARSAQAFPDAERSHVAELSQRWKEPVVN